ncbi:MAG: molybdopterin dinucleotide binding domain-containing protein [Acidimicrobiales bacterium]
MTDQPLQPTLSAPFSRRSFLKGAALTGGGAIVAGWGVSPWVENVFERRGTYVYPDRPPTWPGVVTTFSVCKQCRSDCGLVARTFNGVLEKLDGNPYHPNATEPHAPYATDPAAASVWSQAHSLCARGQAGRQTVYDPFRLTVPLKRSGPRGSGRWQAISWSQLVSEVTGGGYLFSHVAGEEHRYVEGFSDVWNAGKSRFEPIDAANPDFGPKTNGLVVYWGRAEPGQADFLTRFAHAFGSVNALPHVGICELNHHVATQESLNGIGGVAMLKPDVPNAEYIIWFGANVTEANFPMQTLGRKIAEATAVNGLNYVIVDPHAGNGRLLASQWVPIAPGGDGALAMGMIRIILEASTYNAAYLQIPNAKAAATAGEPNFSNAAWLVISDPTHPSYGKFLTTSEAGLVPLSAAGSSGPVVWDLAAKGPVSAASSNAGNLWPSGNLSASTVDVNGIACRTALAELYRSAVEYSIGEYASLAGVSSEVIENLATEFTSHGRKAVADFYRGPAMHTNGVYNGRAIMMLNFLLGNVDWMGGYLAGGGAADFDGKNKGALYPLSSWPGQPKSVPAGVPISREGAFYEKSDAYKRAVAAGKSPFPAPRPWFPFGFGIWPEIFAGIYQQYPYPAKIVLQHEANPAWSPPAIGGAPDDTPWIRMVTDTSKVPLFISTDIVIAESSSYADYIVPDTSYLECWGVPTNFPTYPTKAQGIRRPVIEPLTAKTPNGNPMCMEQFLIDVAKAVGLPGFGSNAFADGGSLDTREDYYLRQVANIAYDPSFLVLGAGGFIKAGAVPDASAADMEMAGIAQLRSSHPGTLPDSVWKKVAYVLARGGRFEDYVIGYLPSKAVVTRLDALTIGQIAESTLERWAMPLGGLSTHDLKSIFSSMVSQVGTYPSQPTWATHTYGSLSKKATEYPCQIYNEVMATTHNALTGALFGGVPRFEHPQTMKGQLLSKLDPASLYPFMLSTHKQPIHSKSRTIADPWLLELMPEAFIEMNPLDAQRFGINAGDQVRVVSATNSRGMVGRVRVIGGIRPGVIAFPAAFGHWQYGSGRWQVNGRTFEGDPARNTPVRLNSVMRLDPDLAAPDGWTIGLEDPVGGGADYYDTRVRVEKI